MTVTPTYPGVYIREIPSGSRTITGVATSITAFIGTARRGPVDEAVPIAGFGDFERAFGGLWRDSGLGYAVRDFFTNGGSSALVIRVVHGADDPNSATDVRAERAQIRLATGTPTDLVLEASGPGAWASGLQVDITYPEGNDADDIAAAQGVAAGDLFNLVVRDGSGDEAPTESYLNVTSGAGPRPVDLVLAGSALVQVSGALPAARPRDGSYALFGLDVGGLPLVTKDITRWAGITAVITHHVTDSGGPADTAATVQGVAVDQLFTLVLKTPATEERYELVTVADGTVVGGSNRIDRAMAGSVLARTGPLPANRPDVDTYEVDIDIDVGGLRLVATDVTRWANGITAGVSHPPDPDPATTAAADAQGVTPADLFTLVLSTPATVERYPLVTVVNGTPAGASNRIDRAMAGSAVGARRHRLASDRPPGRGHLRALVQAERCVRRRRERSRRDRLPRIGERQDRHARPAQGGPVQPSSASPRPAPPGTCPKQSGRRRRPSALSDAPSSSSTRPPPS